MKSTMKRLALLACALPFAALAQTPSAPSSTDKSGATPPGMSNKQTTDTGQSTTYPKSDAGDGMKKSGTTTDREKDKITKGDQKSLDSPMKQVDPSTAQKPAKEGSQSGPTK